MEDQTFRESVFGKNLTKIDRYAPCVHTTRGQIPYAPRFSLSRLAIGILGVCLVVVAVLALNHYLITNEANIQGINVAVYENQIATIPLIHITWGNISLGETLNKTIYVENQSPFAIFLNFNVSNYNPLSFETDITIAWDYDGTTLIGGEVRELELSMNVASNAEIDGAVTFDLFVWGNKP